MDECSDIVNRIEKRLVSKPNRTTEEDELLAFAQAKRKEIEGIKERMKEK